MDEYTTHLYLFYFVISAGLLGLMPAFVADKNGRSFILWWLFGALLFIDGRIASGRRGAPRPAKSRWAFFQQAD